MTQNKKIAVTGGIGSGKSTVCSLLREQGYCVFSCDDINRELWQDRVYLQSLCDMFPSCVVNGTIDRRLLGALVFQDCVQLERLNAFSHPKIMDRLIQRMQDCHKTAFAEVPLLFEGGFQTYFDEIIVVKRNLARRVDAVAKRDRLSDKEVLARVERQYSYDGTLEQNCFIIENNGEIEDLACRLQAFLKMIS